MEGGMTGETHHKKAYSFRLVTEYGNHNMNITNNKHIPDQI